MHRRLKAAIRTVAVGVVRCAYPIAERKNWIREAGVSSVATPSPPAGDEPEGASPVVPPLPTFLEDFNHLLHELRTIELGRMPSIGGTMLSAGCADAYYFDWIDSSYQHVQQHIGLELYLPEPPVLPSNVTWIANSVGKMTSVGDGSVDLVFSGQNFEHLFGDDAPDFLLECHRVVGPDGWLVIDSPHREIAAALGWSMPEHTVEFTPSEAVELVQLAGFDVRSVRGLWLCQDPRSGEHFALWGPDGEAPDPAEVLRRSVVAPEDVERSFVWWLEAQRTDRAPDVDGLRQRHAEVFRIAWQERQQRLKHVVGNEVVEDDTKVIRVADGVEGYAMFGPYSPLAPGKHSVTFSLRRTGEGDPGREAALVEITDMGGAKLADAVLRVQDLPPGEWSEHTVTAHTDDVVWGAQFRVFVTGSVGLDVRLSVVVDDSGTQTAPSLLRA